MYCDTGYTDYIGDWEETTITSTGYGYPYYMDELEYEFDEYMDSRIGWNQYKKELRSTNTTKYKYTTIRNKLHNKRIIKQSLLR